MVIKNELLPSKPCTELFEQLSPKLFCRSGRHLAAGTGHSAPAQGKGTRHTEEPPGGSEDLPGVHVVGEAAATLTPPHSGVHIPGVPVLTHQGTNHEPRRQ